MPGFDLEHPVEVVLGQIQRIQLAIDPGAEDQVSMAEQKGTTSAV